ncbi:MAG: SRPBCC family protein [Solirubrobacteraceae bacterium]
MKHLDGRAGAEVPAPIATCFSLLAAIERYPRWCGEFIREVSSVERGDDGRPVRAHVVVYVAQSPFWKRFEFDATIRTEPPRAVYVSRLPSSPGDEDRFSLSWSLMTEGERTHVGLVFSAAVSFLPSVLPLPGVGDLIAGALLDAAARELGASTTPGPGAPSS